MKKLAEIGKRFSTGYWDTESRRL